MTTVPLNVRRPSSLTPPSPRTLATVAIETHGCKLNQADSSRLARQFAEAGFRLVSPGEEADVYVLNTCTVTHVADRKARQHLRTVRRRMPNATIVATGCYPQRAPQDVQGIHEVDLVVGNVGKDDLVRQIVERWGEPAVPCATGSDDRLLTQKADRTRAMIKIQEGCNQVCAYCIVPRVRGRERSIRPRDIIGEINRCAAEGYKEVVLTGTQLGSYGFDLPGMTLTVLVERILARTAIPRLRISSLQPQDMGPDLLDLWSDPRLCPHFHMPLQSGSNRVLQRMRRRYTAQIYAETVERIRRKLPDASVTADVIVGFPGETEEDFEETFALCKRIEFASVHVFPYSVRPGTSASHFGDKVAPEVKSRRARALTELAESHSAVFKGRFVDGVRPVLWEGTREADGSSAWSGLTDNYIRLLAHSPRDLMNQVTLARITAVSGGFAYAQVLRTVG